MGLVFVDCEAWGGCPATGELTEFGAVTPQRQTFHGVLVKSCPDPNNPAVPVPVKSPYIDLERRLTMLTRTAKRLEVFSAFDTWLRVNSEGRPIFVSDNPAFDWQWINDGFYRTLGRNPFGHSARRISDYYAGLVGDFNNTQKWKKLRVTPHDHNPVNDAMGNLEAWERLQKGER